MTRCHNLTARCPRGCECWLHPAAVRSHIRPDHCRGKPWVADVPETVIVTGDEAKLLTEALPAKLIGWPIRDGRPTTYLNGDPSITIASPLPGVAPRRWLQVALAAAARSGPSALLAAVDPKTFDRLEAEFGRPDLLVVCPDCGETVGRRGVAVHQARSARCRWMHAAAEVRRAWEEGWRDPYSMPSGTPLTWTELQSGMKWRKQIRTVAFPHWTAVLLSPASRW